MGRYKKSTRQHRNEEYDAYFDQFEAIGEAPSGAASFLTLFGVMMFTMIVSFLPYCIQYDSSPSLFRRVYRMSRHSFDKLHSILEPALNKIFFPRGGGVRKPGKSSYLIDTKTRLAILILFAGGRSVRFPVPAESGLARLWVPSSSG